MITEEQLLMLQPGDYIEEPSTNSLFEFIKYTCDDDMYTFKTLYSEYCYLSIWSVNKSNYYFIQCYLPSKERAQYYKKLIIFK